MKPADVDAFVAHFQEGYYCDRDSIHDAIKNHGLFYIIDHASGFKADFVILKNTAFRQVEFKRRKEVAFMDKILYVVSAEDLLVSKLIWIQEFQNNLQMEDIKNLSALEELDWTYIRHWITALNLNTFALLP